MAVGEQTKKNKREDAHAITLCQTTAALFDFHVHYLSLSHTRFITGMVDCPALTSAPSSSSSSSGVGRVAALSVVSGALSRRIRRPER